MHNVDIRNISMGEIMYFVKVAETLNVSKSAEYFNLTQPTLSKKIAALEAQLDLQLFIRTNRISGLTPAGKYLYKQWKHSIHQIEEEIQNAHILQTGKSKSLVIGCMDSFIPDLFLVPLVKSCRKRYPDVHIRIEAESAQEIRNMLLQDEADLIISILYDFEESEMEQITYKEAGQTTHCACMNRSNPLSAKKSLTVADLQTSEFVCISPRQLPSYIQMIQNLCEPYGFSPNITNYVSSAKSLTMNILSDHEIFICDKYYQDDNSSEHVRLPVKDTESSVVIAWKKNNRKPYLRDIVKLAEQILAEQEPSVDCRC